MDKGPTYINAVSSQGKSFPHSKYTQIKDFIYQVDSGHYMGTFDCNKGDLDQKTSQGEPGIVKSL